MLRRKTCGLYWSKGETQRVTEAKTLGLLRKQQFGECFHIQIPWDTVWCSCESDNGRKNTDNEAMTRCGKIVNILNSDKIDLDLKLRLYETSVLSSQTYGCETWTLSPRVLRMINGANSRMLVHLLHKTINTRGIETSNNQLTSLNLTRRIRQRRLRWVSRRSYPASRNVQADLQNPVGSTATTIVGNQGNLFMDTPPHSNMDHLASIIYILSNWTSQRQIHLDRPRRLKVIPQFW